MKTFDFKPSFRILSAFAGGMLGLAAGWPAGTPPESARAPAAGCGYIRLDDRGGSMEHVKVRNQRSIGSCYAHAAAQLYDAWRFRNGDVEYGHSSAGFEISQRFKWDRDETSVDAGHIQKILPKLFAEGTCSQEELDSLFRGITLDQYASEVMRIFNRHRDEYHRQMSELREMRRNEGSYGARAEPQAPRTPRDYLRDPRAQAPRIDNLRVDRRHVDVRFAQWLLSEQLKQGVAELKEYNKRVCVIGDPHIPYDRLRADSNTVHLFEMISLAECPEQRRIYAKGRFRLERTRTHRSAEGLIPGFLDAKEDRFKPELSLPILDRELDRGLRKAYPIAIDYCSKIFKQGRDYPRMADGRKTMEVGGDECGRHASLVIGRRTNPKTGRCQYLIRNSWGEAASERERPRICGSYHADWDCDAAKGSVWIDGDKLGQAIYDVKTVVPIAD